MIYFNKQTLYIQIFTNRFDILHVQENTKITEYSEKSFTTERLAIGHWLPAEITFKKALNKISHGKLFILRPVIVMHPMIKTEGGLCEVEERILKELGRTAGGKKIFIWIGTPLTREQLLSKEYKNVA